jgi:hypothetical protein
LNLKDAVHAFVEFTRIQMGITEPVIIYYSWEELEHFNYPIPDKALYNKLLGWSDRISGNSVILVNLRMHQSFQTVIRTIVHELFHIKFPKITDEGEIERYTYRWLETRHTEFGFYYDAEFLQQFSEYRRSTL